MSIHRGFRAAGRRLRPHAVRAHLGRLAWYVSGVALLAGLAASLVLPVYAQNQGQTIYHILSGSMEPTHLTRTTILVDRNIARDSLLPGQVITYLTGPNVAPTTHRIIERFTDDGGQLWYRTKGDNNSTADPNPVSPYNVLGVVTTDLDHVWAVSVLGDLPIGQWITWAATTTGKVVLFAPAILLMLAGELRIVFTGARLPRLRKHGGDPTSETEAGTAPPSLDGTTPDTGTALEPLPADSVPSPPAPTSGARALTHA